MFEVCWQPPGADWVVLYSSSSEADARAWAEAKRFAPFSLGIFRYSGVWTFLGRV